MSGDQWQRGAYQWKKDKERRARQRDAYNREQMESEASAAADVRPPHQGPQAQDRFPAARGYEPGAVAAPADDRSHASHPILAGLARAVMVVAGIIAILALFSVFLGDDSSFPALLVSAFVAWVAYSAQRAWGGREKTSARGGAQRAGRERARGGIVGEARGLQRRLEESGNRNVEVLSFRVERYDAKGNRLTPVPVQMRGTSFEGSVQEGDQVRVSGQRSRRGTVSVDRVENLTTRSTVKAKRTMGAEWVATFIFVAVIVIIIVLTSGMLN